MKVMHHINTLKDKYYIHVKKVDKIQHLFMIKIQQRGIQRMYLNIIKAICDKPTPDITLSGEKLKTFPLRSATRQECPLSPLSFSTVLKVLTRALSQQKERKDIQIGK